MVVTVCGVLLVICLLEEFASLLVLWWASLTQPNLVRIRYLLLNVSHLTGRMPHINGDVRVREDTPLAVIMFVGGETQLR